MSNSTKKEILKGDKPFVLMWAEEASDDSLKAASRVLTQGLESASEDYRRPLEKSKKLL